MRGAILSLIILIQASSAQAQSSTELAKRYYKLGEELYMRAAYDEALENFKRSYKFSGKPELFYNMGRCEEALGLLEAAIGHYEAYLKTGPPQADLLKARLANLRKRLIPKKPAPAAKPKPRDQPTPELASPPAKATSPEPEKRGLGVKGLAGWISVGVGVALIGTGAALGALASSKSDEVETAWADGKEWADISDNADSGQNMETGAIVSLAMGGAVLATGAVLLVLHYTGGQKESPTTAWIAPTVTPGGAAVGAGIRF